MFNNYMCVCCLVVVSLVSMIIPILHDAYNTTQALKFSSVVANRKSPASCLAAEIVAIFRPRSRWGLCPSGRLPVIGVFTEMGEFKL